MLSALAYLTSLGNAPIAIAIGVAALFSLPQVTGVLGLIAGGEGESDHDGENEGRGLAATALEPLGLGKIPFSMVWQTFALAFAMTGLALNWRYLGVAGGAPVYTLLWTMPASTVAAVFESPGAPAAEPSPEMIAVQHAVVDKLDAILVELRASRS